MLKVSRGRVVASFESNSILPKVLDMTELDVVVVSNGISDGKEVFNLVATVVCSSVFFSGVDPVFVSCIVAVCVG